MRPRKSDRHLPPCVYHRHGAYWLVKAGKWTRLGDVLHLALAEYAKRQSPNLQGSMAELIDAALAAKTGLALNTVRNYKLLADRLKTIMVEFRPEDVLPRHIAQIRHSLAKSPGMANLAISVLRITFAYALENQLVDSDPTLGIKRFTTPERERLISTEEYGKIRTHAGPGLRVIMDLCYLTGQRISDVLNIRHADLTEEGIQFRQQKTGARLTIRWTTELRAAVESAKALYGNLRALTLLHDRRGRPLDYSGTEKQWRLACKAAGVLDAHLHDLRAMASTAAQDQGIDPQKLLGHKNAQTTKRYLRSKRVPVVDGPSIGQVLENWTERLDKSRR